MEDHLRVYNTLTRQKEPFQTVVPGKVGMYLCGPTVYKPSHLGHMVGLGGSEQHLVDVRTIQQARHEPAVSVAEAVENGG